MERKAGVMCAMRVASQDVDNEDNDSGILISQTMLDTNMIPFIGKISDKSYSDMMIAASYFMNKKPKKGETITVLVKSDGGEFSSFTGIYALLGQLKNRGYTIRTIGVGMIASAGVLLVMAGNKGERHIYSTCSIFTHDMCLEDSASNLNILKAEVSEIERLRDKYLQIFAHHSKLSLEESSEFLSRDRYVSPGKAKKMGMVDHIIDDISFHKVKKKNRSKKNG